jgi:putative transposase
MFLSARDRRFFMAHMRDAREKHGCDLHAFVLMTNHIHLLATGREPGAISRMMQAIGRRYVRYINRAYGRTGTLFEGRFKSSLIETDRYLLTCMRYIELNPVRAGIAAAPGEYMWSSYRQNASGMPCESLAPHPTYLELSSDPWERGAAYRALFSQALSSEELEIIRERLGRNGPLLD